MTDEADRATRWVVGGRVQGVGFRWFTARQAQSIPVGGWVCNLPDGRVEVVARGTRAQLDALERAIREGPTGANVESVEKSDVPHQAVPAKVFGIK